MTDKTDIQGSFVDTGQKVVEANKNAALTIDLGGTLPNPNTPVINSPNPPDDPLNKKSTYNYRSLLKAALENLAKKEPASKFSYRDPVLYHELKNEKGVVEDKAVLSINNNNIVCYNPGQSYINKKTSLAMAAEVIVALPEGKQPKCITLSGTDFADCVSFAKILREKGIKCDINIQTVDAHGNKHIQSVDQTGELVNKPQELPEETSPKLRP